MKPLRPCVLALTLALAACQSLPGGRDGDVAAVLAASGLEAQLAWLRQPLQEDRSAGPLALIPDEWIQVVNSTVAATLRPTEMRDALARELQENLSGRELAEVQRFYESATGRRVVAVESGSADPRVSAALDTESATLAALAQATGLGKAVSLLAENALGDAIDIALRSGCLGDQPAYVSLLGGVMKKAQLLALRRAVNDGIRARHARLSPQEQSSYLAFAQSRAGQKFLSTRTAILNGFAQKAGSALGTELTPRISEICKASA
ncbi:MAG: DUF2059 domain-containing protein [Pseudomonadota bacterium]